jgi:hypothetical protein
MLPGERDPIGSTDVPRGPSGSALGGLGDVCSEFSGCQSDLCLDITDDGLPPFCSTQCSGSECPEGMVCRATTAGISVCGFDAAPPARRVGADCRFDLDCATSLCLDLEGDAWGKFCSGPCQADRDCPPAMFCADLPYLGPSCIF